jgi:hypothetical protein
VGKDSLYQASCRGKTKTHNVSGCAQEDSRGSTNTLGSMEGEAEEGSLAASGVHNYTKARRGR